MTKAEQRMFEAALAIEKWAEYSRQHGVDWAMDVIANTPCDVTAEISECSVARSAETWYEAVLAADAVATRLLSAHEARKADGTLGGAE